jgi:putative phosphonate catabolism associated alcohol dehydrogenase
MVCKQMSSINRNLAHIQVFHGAGQPFELQTTPLPDQLGPDQLGPDEVLVEISLATICGSDLHTVDGRRSAPAPCVLGHEAVGRVILSARQDILVGQRVTWSLVDSCGHCLACTRWRLPQKCESLFKYGHAGLVDRHGLNGCYASHIVLRSGTAVIPIPNSLPDSVAVPANCALATIVNAIGRLPESVEKVLVQGAGLLGLYACAWLNCRGVKDVYCIDPAMQRLALVSDFGAQPISPGEEIPEVDLVLEVAGTSAVISQGVAALRPGGMYVWAGMVHPETPLDLTGEMVVRKCLTVRGIHNYSPEDLVAAVQFLCEQQNRFPFEQLVSPPVPLQELDHAFDLARQKKWQRVAVCPK